MLNVEGVSKTYGGTRARAVLHDVSLALCRGEYVAIVGESGSGKSTLLNLIAGLDVPDRGRITIDGIEITGLDDDSRTRVRRNRIGFVFQAFHLLPHLTALQNVALPLVLNRFPPDEADERAARLLAEVGMAQAAAAYPRELSGGELQRAAIARALAHGPALLLADEPTGNLDPEAARDVLALLRRQVKTSAGAGILVTHSALAAATADRVLRLTAEGLHPAGS